MANPWKFSVNFINELTKKEETKYFRKQNEAEDFIKSLKCHLRWTECNFVPSWVENKRA